MKKSNPSKEPASWTVWIYRKRATRLGTIEAKDRDEALRKAIEHFDVRPADQWRISVQRGK